ncbi:hypothetical protein FEM48_Zijuj02G0151300 [Ziziphus jujuba var. spinosa]|uniref:Cullin N-terminal domain-containing protein n=1 Tax=Ziziphus jujuba var. spinosa TaxID=714518 RepID=A0A978VWE1_ZIZJJ|nr:hypothetical protein FEM48_Zijuj02G0151300 [Ziziphus jujuba var. spinosa]
MVRWLSRFFHYLDRWLLPSYTEVGLKCFRDQELNARVRDAVISLIDQEREGEQNNQALLKNVLDIFVELGMGQMVYYKKDFEAAMLEGTAPYYSRKASNWILEYSCPDYMLKKVQHELLSVYATQLLENENSGCHALLRDDKRICLECSGSSKIPKGLDLVSNIFKQHVTAEGRAFVKQADDASSNEKVNMDMISASFRQIPEFSKPEH